VAIGESVRRIGSIALVHETLSRSAGDEVDLDEIVKPLVRMVEDGLSSPDRPLDIRIIGSGGTLASPAATSLAVVLNELLQNVFDHAYPPGTLEDGQEGAVRIVMSHDNEGIQVLVRDDGVGPGDAVTSGATDSLGLSIVRGLVSDLQGTIVFSEAGGLPGRVGTQAAVNIPVLADRRV
jgi:two-component sensor histidine kinase